MCGIAGFTHRTRVVSGDAIREATLSLHHRGPDQQDVHHSNHISLGAVRLKIIDLEGGDQPVISEDGDAVIAFNGEIYNHAELREELRRRGHTFRSKCDTEVVLKAFLEWDLECFSRLRGMFGLAVWSESRRRLVLARDRMGIKPLYFHRRGEDIYFGSELKAILAHPEVERTLDLVGLTHYLSLNYVPCPYTLVAGIEKVPPGQWLEWTDGRVSTGTYWQLALRPDSHWDLNSAKEALDGLLKNSIREHLVADVPLGVWASGGLDSSAILHYAAEQVSSPLKTFSVSFEGRSFNEAPYFREMAGKYGTDHHEFDLNTGLDLASAVEELSLYSDEPSADAGALPVWFLSRMTRQHVTVALSGEGADELFGGYLTYRADKMARWFRMIPSPLRRIMLRGLGCWPVSDNKISLEYKLKRMVEGSLLDPDEAHSYWNGAFSGQQKRSFFKPADGRGVRPLYAALPAGQHESGLLGRYLWFDQYYYLPDDILYKCDRMSMAHSLEVRPAFLDHRIVEFAASLPDHLKLNGSRQKFVLRELMRNKLPQSILTRKKEGFDIPAHEWLRTALRPLLLDTVTTEAVNNTGVFRPEPIAALVRNHMERRANLGYHLWGLLTLFLWMRRWNIQGAMTPSAARESDELPAYTN